MPKKFPKQYLDRIGYKGVIDSSYKTLSHLQKAHLLNIPFENLDIHYNRPIELNIDKIYNKIINNKRGGFCYELNGLFYELLKSLGFNAKIISARVFDGKSNYGAEFDHLALIVTIGKIAYLVDVGFGEFTFAPLKIELDILQHDSRGDFVIHKFDEPYLQVNQIIDGQKQAVYIFQNQERRLTEFKAMCNYHQSSPKSHFTQKKLITRPTENGRITLTNKLLKIKENDKVEEKVIPNEDAFNSELMRWFSI